MAAQTGRSSGWHTAVLLNPAANPAQLLQWPSPSTNKEGDSPGGWAVALPLTHPQPPPPRLGRSHVLGLEHLQPIFTAKLGGTFPHCGPRAGVPHGFPGGWATILTHALALFHLGHCPLRVRAHTGTFLEGQPLIVLSSHQLEIILEKRASKTTCQT